MDRREAMKTAAAMAFASAANPALIKPPPMSSKQLEKMTLEWNKQRSEEFYHAVMPPTAKRTKWRIVDQMIEEQGGEA